MFVEYCASRAVPNVSLSEYLNTIGSKLLPGVDILWTGKLSLLKCVRKKKNDSTFTIASIIQLAIVAFLVERYHVSHTFF